MEPVSTPLGFNTRIVLSVALAVVALLGLITNCLGIIVVIRHPNFSSYLAGLTERCCKIYQNPFGHLTTVHSLANIGILSIFLFWTCPAMIFNFTGPLKHTNTLLGLICLFCFEMSVHACLSITVNRLVAVLFPFKYRSLFSHKITFLIIFIIFIFSSFYFVGCLLFECNFSFNFFTCQWEFELSNCGGWISVWIDFRYNVIVFTFIVIMDLLTIARLVHIRWRLVQRASSIVESPSKWRRQALFFGQAFVNSTTYCLMLFSFHVVSVYTEHSAILSFFTTTFVWGLSHAAGGFILVGFNVEILKILAKPANFCSFIINPKRSVLLAKMAWRKHQYMKAQATWESRMTSLTTHYI